MPTISISSPGLTTPRSTRPVTTVPRPLIPKTSSIGIRNGLSTARAKGRDVVVDGLHQLQNRAIRRISRVLAEALQGRQGTAPDDRDLVAGNS